MTDNLSAQQRRKCMQAVCGKDTSPELEVRRLLHSMGYRYRLHSQSLPGKPDIVFPSRKKVILIHGCFWHSHTCSHGRVKPISNQTYWSAKLERNALRDRQNARALRKAGWKVLVLWECKIKDIAKLTKRLGAFLA